MPRKKRTEAQGVMTVKAQFSRRTSDELMKVINSMENKLRDFKIVNSSEENFEYPSYYKRPKWQPPKATASALLDPQTTQLIIEVFAGWVGGKILENIWSAIKGDIKPILFNKNDQFEFHIKHALSDSTLIIRIHASNPQQLAASKKLVPQALKLANDWVRNKGFTHKYIIVVIEGSNVMPVPILRDQV